MIPFSRVLLFVFFLAGLLPTVAAPLASPLTLTTDAIGADLQQNFIAAPGSPATASNGFIAYRKSFTLATAPASATMYLFADVRYILWINGQPVHRGPNRFVTAGPQYDAVEIGSALRSGSNTIAIVVMTNGSNAKMMSHTTGLTLRIDIAGATVVRTDTTWKWSNNTRYRPASVSWPDIIDRIDSRVENGDWTLPAYNDSAWSAAAKISGDSWGPLAARRIPLLRDTPVATTFTGGATLPITLTTGQQLNFTTGGPIVQAYTIIQLNADANTQLRFDYAGGTTYYAKAGAQTYISSDSYAFSGGALTVVSGRATITSLKFMERLYPFDLVGSFNSSDPLLNRLWTVCARSLQVLSEDAYVDCADRERAEWMDCDPPGFDVTRTAMSAPGPDGQPRYADARLSGEMLRRTALTLQPDGSNTSSGWVKAHTSSDRFDIHAKMEDRACDWVEGARRYYDSTGDTAVIKEIWPVIVKQMNYFLARKSTRGLIRAREWVVWGNPIGYFTCEGTGLNAFVYKALTDAAYLGQAIGFTSQAATFSQSATDLSTAMNTVLWDETTGSYFSAYYSAADQAAPENAGLTTPLAISNEKIAPSMFSVLWMLDQGVVPDARKARVTQYLLANRAQAARIMTFYYLFNQLYQQNTAAFDTEILNTIRTNWAGMANSSTLTTWEEFSGGSMAHCYGMFPGYFMSAYVLGVRLDGVAAAKKLIIEPRPGDLSFASGTVVTEFGPVPISWQRRNGGLAVTCTIPAGTTATLRLPRFDTTLPPTAMLNGQKIATPVLDGRYVVVPVSAGAQTLTVSSDLTWQGGGTNAWDTATANWRDVNNATSAFVVGANAVFNDTGANSPAISLSGAFSPAGVTVDTSKNYTFAGAGSLAGGMALTKNGSGTLTLALANSFTGGIALNGGAVSISNSANLGTGPLSFAGGQLLVTANTTINNTLQIASGSTAQIDTQGNNVTQSGPISSLDGTTGNWKKSGTGTLTFTGTATYAGATLIAGGTLKLGPSSAPPVTAGLLYRLDASNPASLTLSGANVAAWSSSQSSSTSFTQSTTARQPAYVANALNGKPVVRFSGAQQLLLSAPSAPQEVVAVTTVKSGVDGNIGGFLGLNGADTGLRLNSSPGTWAPDGGTTEINGTVATAYPANQAHVMHRYGTSWGAWGATGFGQYFNDGTTRFFNGDVAELLVYGTALSAIDRTKLRTYLDAKWRNISSASAVISTLPAATTVTLSASGATWDLGGATQTIAALSGVAGSSVLLSGGSLTVGDGTSTQFAGTFSGSGSLVKTGAGVLTLSGSSSISGPVTISQGTLRLTGSLATTSTVAIGAGDTLDLTGGTLSASQIQIAPGGTLIGPGTLTGLVVNAGTVNVYGDALAVQGNFINTGILRLLSGATFSNSGTFTNNGLLDRMTGGASLPANFTNNGTVLDKSAVKVNSIQATATAFTIRITAYAGHTYQLQASDTLDADAWTSLGAPLNGTGAELVFSEAMNSTTPRRFYRIIVSP